MLICPMCGSIAGMDNADRIVCSNLSCNWSDWAGKTNKTQNDFIQPKKVDNVEEKTTEKNNDSTLRYYFVEYIGADSELLQANCLYDLIKKMLEQEEEFSYFVERCYQSFRDSSVIEMVQFYNHFSEFTIEKISELEKLNVVYEKEIKEC